MAANYLNVGGQQFQGPDAVKSNRKLAEALVQQGMNPGRMVHPLEALGSVMQTGMGALRNDFANADERNGKAAGSKALAEMLAGGDGSAAMANPYSSDQAMQIRMSDRTAARSEASADRKRQLEMQSPEYQLGLELKREQLEASKADRAAKAAAQQRDQDFYRQFEAEPSTSRFSPPMRLGGPTSQQAAGPVVAAQAAARAAPETYDMAPEAEPQQQPANSGPMTARQLFDSLTPEDQAAGRMLLQSGDKQGFIKLLQTSGVDASRVKQLEGIGIDPNSAEGQTFRATGKMPAAAYQQIALNQRRKTQASGIMSGLSNLNRATTDYNDAAFTNALGPIQGSEPSWMGAPFTAAARLFGEAANAYEGGNATPNEVRNSIIGSTEALAAAIKPLIRAPGEGPWTDADQARLVAIVGDLAQSSTKEEYKRRLNGVADRVRTNFNLDIPFDAFADKPAARRTQGEGAGANGFSIKRVR